MSITLQAVREALEDAKHTQQAADTAAAELAEVLVGRLRQVSKSRRWGTADTLRKLKKELHDFNAVTGRWKAPK